MQLGWEGEFEGVVPYFVFLRRIVHRPGPADGPRKKSRPKGIIVRSSAAVSKCYRPGRSPSSAVSSSASRRGVPCRACSPWPVRAVRLTHRVSMRKGCVCVALALAREAEKAGSKR